MLPKLTDPMHYLQELHASLRGLVAAERRKGWRAVSRSVATAATSNGRKNAYDRARLQPATRLFSFSTRITD